MYHKKAYNFLNFYIDDAWIKELKDFYIIPYSNLIANVLAELNFIVFLFQKDRMNPHDFYNRIKKIFKFTSLILLGHYDLIGNIPKLYQEEKYKKFFTSLPLEIKNSYFKKFDSLFNLSVKFISIADLSSRSYWAMFKPRLSIIADITPFFLVEKTVNEAILYMIHVHIWCWHGLYYVIEKNFSSNSVFTSPKLLQSKHSIEK